MRMKEDRGAERPWPKPAYNVQMGTEGQFIVGFSVHDRAGDTGCLIPHLEQVRQNTGGRLPQNMVADAAYGSEENYAYLEQQAVGNYLKYNTFYQDTHRYRDPAVLRAHQFHAENFAYDPETDTFICPADQRLHFQYTSRYTTDNGYPRSVATTNACLCRLPAAQPVYAGQGQPADSHQLPLTRLPLAGPRQSDQRRRSALTCGPLRGSGDGLRAYQTEHGLPTIPLTRAGKSEDRVGARKYRPQHEEVGGRIGRLFVLFRRSKVPS